MHQTDLAVRSGVSETSDADPVPPGLDGHRGRRQQCHAEAGGHEPGHCGEGHGRLNEEFADRDAQVLGASVDNKYVHHAWHRQHEDLRDLPFPMLSDIKREFTRALGVLNADGVADRATFLVDPDGVIQFVMVTAGSVGRNVAEVLRVLDALQTDELCPCNWRKGAETLDAGQLLGA